MNKWIALAAVAVIAGGGWWMLRPAPAPTPMTTAGQGTRPGAAPGNPETGETVAVTMPANLSAQAKRGQQYFRATCARCHGPNAGGLEGNGPPLVHPYYRPGHHSDAAIMLAVRRGVRSHHWRYGNMPVIEGITDGEITDIIAFIRAVQQANGIQ